MSKKRAQLSRRRVAVGGATVAQRDARHPYAPTLSPTPNTNNVAIDSNGNVIPREGQLAQMLKNTILARRQAQGLGEIPVILQQQSVSHELTPEELEKKERRKEQNRRAARKCREKKRLLQTAAACDFGKILEENQKMEEEISTLRQEKENLQKILSDHMGSGTCVYIKQEEGKSSCFSNPTTDSLLTSSSCSISSTASNNHVPLHIDKNVYLEGMEHLSPEDTFVGLSEDLGLETAMDNDSLQWWGSLMEYNKTPIPITSTPMTTVCTVKDELITAMQANVHEISTFVEPSFCCNRADGGRGSLADDPVNSLKMLCSQTTCRFSPISSPGSPATFARNRDLHDRHPSTSSVASDWSAVSDQSQGFQMVPVNPAFLPQPSSPDNFAVQGYNPSVGSFSSEAPEDMMEFAGSNQQQLPPWARVDDEEEEDDVFMTSPERIFRRA